MAGKLIFLVGYMGSGKSTLGKKLAQNLGLPFLDLDQLIVARAGMSIPDIFREHGEEGFRLREAEVLRDLDTDAAAVVAVGGGAPCFHDNMRWMNDHGRSIYLRLSAKAIWRRLEQSDIHQRPVLQGLQGEALLQFIEEKLAGREPFYLQATCIIDQLKDKIPAIIEKCNLK